MVIVVVVEDSRGCGWAVVRVEMEGLFDDVGLRDYEVVFFEEGKLVILDCAANCVLASLEGDLEGLVAVIDDDTSWIGGVGEVASILLFWPVHVGIEEGVCDG